MVDESQFQDKTIVCQDCGTEFVFTARDQAFYAEKGFKNEPKRCKNCRDNRKNQKREDRNNNDNENGGY